MNAAPIVLPPVLNREASTLRLLLILSTFCEYV